MSLVTRTTEVAREFALVLPRTASGLKESTGWSPASPRGARQFGEVMLDELVLAGFSLLGGNLTERVRPLTECEPAAEELSVLGIDGAHADPKPLRPTSIQRRRIAGLAYERVTFEHDPALPTTLAAEGLGGPARAVVHVCRHTDGPRPWLVWVHGAGQGGTEDLVLSRIGRIHHKLGFNVAMPVQPGHGCRRREWPAYPDMDPLGNVAGMMRSVSEVRAVVRWVQPQATAVVVSGISMGTPVAALVSHLERDIDAVGLYTPILGLNGMIARHLKRFWAGQERTPGVADIAGRFTTDLGDRPAGRRPGAPAGAPADRRRVARPNGHARAHDCAAGALGRPTVLVRRQPRRSHFLPARAEGVRGVPARGGR